MRIRAARITARGALILSVDRLRPASPSGAALIPTPTRSRRVVGGPAVLAVGYRALTAGEGPPAVVATSRRSGGLGSNNVFAFDADGSFITDSFLQAPKGVTFRTLEGLAFAAKGDLFVANGSTKHPSSNQVLRFRRASSGTPFPWKMVGAAPFSQGRTASNPGVSNPVGLALGPVGASLAVSSRGVPVVTRLGGPNGNSPGAPGAVASAWSSADLRSLPGTLAPPATRPTVALPKGVATPTPVASADGGLDAPADIAFTGDGATLYVADTTGGGLRSYDAATGAYTGALIGAATAPRPVGVDIDGDQKVWITNEGATSVVSIQPKGAISGIAEFAKSAFDRQLGMKIDVPGGIVAAADRAGDRVVLLTVKGEKSLGAAPTGLVCLDPASGDVSWTSGPFVGTLNDIALLPGARVSAEACGSSS
jgi:hypothetical protein